MQDIVVPEERLGLLGGVPAQHPNLFSRSSQNRWAVGRRHVSGEKREKFSLVGPTLPLKLRLDRSKVRGHYNGCIYKLSPRCQHIYFGLTQILELDVYDC